VISLHETVKDHLTSVVFAGLYSPKSGQYMQGISKDETCVRHSWPMNYASCFSFDLRRSRTYYYNYIKKKIMKRVECLVSWAGPAIIMLGSLTYWTELRWLGRPIRVLFINYGWVFLFCLFIFSIISSSYLNHFPPHNDRERRWRGRL
jgi:hypothetical protein